MTNNIQLFRRIINIFKINGVKLRIKFYLLSHFSGYIFLAIGRRYRSFSCPSTNTVTEISCANAVNHAWVLFSFPNSAVPVLQYICGTNQTTHTPFHRVNKRQSFLFNQINIFFLIPRSLQSDFPNKYGLHSFPVGNHICPGIHLQRCYQQIPLSNGKMVRIPKYQSNLLIKPCASPVNPHPFLPQTKPFAQFIKLSIPIHSPVL